MACNYYLQRRVVRQSNTGPQSVSFFSALRRFIARHRATIHPRMPARDEPLAVKRMPSSIMHSGLQQPQVDAARSVMQRNTVSNIPLTQGSASATTTRQHQAEHKHVDRTRVGRRRNKGPKQVRTTSASSHKSHATTSSRSQSRVQSSDRPRPSHRDY